MNMVCLAVDFDRRAANLVCCFCQGLLHFFKNLRRHHFAPVFGCEDKVHAKLRYAVAAPVKIDEIVGIDLGLKDLVIKSSGRKEPNPKHMKRAQKNLRRKAKKFSRTKKGSRRHEKARRRLAKAYKRMSNAREDNLHKISRRLIDENQAVCAESLKIKSMMQNPHLAKAIADAGWGELCRMLDYKAKRAGKRFVRIDTFFPSSKTCSVCGHRLDKLDLATREWTCPKCGVRHDRDRNASNNVRAEGIRMMKAAGQTVLKRVLPAQLVERV